MEGRRISWPTPGAVLVVATLVGAGCGQATGGMKAQSIASASGVPAPPSTSRAFVPVPPASAPSARTIQTGSVAPDAPLAGRSATLTIAQTTLRLPTPTSRAVAFPSATGFVVAGGLTATGTTGRVVRVPVDGRPPSMVGRLARPVHDAGGAELRGSMLLLGGGAATQDAWVQRVVIDGRSDVRGSLPAARADLAAVVAGSEVVVVGGGASGRADPRVLATSDGIHFRVVANLPIPVRYAAVVAVGSTVLVIGGASSAGDVATIQAVDLGRGTAAVVGRLPMTMSHATALVLGGVVVVAGGRHRGRPLDSVLEVDPTSFAIREAGHLPHAASDAAGVVLGGVGYLVGGEATRPLATIVRITAR